MARRQRPEGEEEGADEALRVQEVLADVVRCRRTLMPHRMESLCRRLPLEVRRKQRAQPGLHVERVLPVAPVPEVDVDPHRRPLLVPVAHRRAGASRTGLATERSPHASS